jgi:hypothetical protein
MKKRFQFSDERGFEFLFVDSSIQKITIEITVRTNGFTIRPQQQEFCQSVIKKCQYKKIKGWE